MPAPGFYAVRMADGTDLWIPASMHMVMSKPGAEWQAPYFVLRELPAIAPPDRWSFAFRERKHIGRCACGRGELWQYLLKSGDATLESRFVCQRDDVSPCALNGARADRADSGPA